MQARFAAPSKSPHSLGSGILEVPEPFSKKPDPDVDEKKTSVTCPFFSASRSWSFSIQVCARVYLAALEVRGCGDVGSDVAFRISIAQGMVELSRNSAD
jgi:hypothetical protein